MPTLRSAFYMTYPRAWALAEDLWTPDELKNWDNFVHRVEYQFQRSDMAGMNYSKAIYDAIVRVSMKEGNMWVEMEPEGPVTMRVVSYRNSSQIGHMIILTPDQLKRRAGRKVEPPMS